LLTFCALATPALGDDIAKKHQKPTKATMQGGIIDKEMPIHVSNVAMWCNKCGATRVGYRIDDDGKKTRICRSSRSTRSGSTST